MTTRSRNIAIVAAILAAVGLLVWHHSFSTRRPREQRIGSHDSLTQWRKALLLYLQGDERMRLALAGGSVDPGTPGRIQEAAVTAEDQRPVVQDLIALERPLVRTEVSPSNGSARLAVSVDVVNLKPQETPVRLRGVVALENSEQGGNGTAFEATLALGPSRREAFTTTVNVESPSLWWPSGVGAQPLYKLALTASVGDELAARLDTRFGIRELGIMAGGTDGEEMGCDACFRANRAKDFRVRGAVLASVPTDAAEQERLIRLAGAAGFNTLGVEGKVESDRFYDLCDHYGLAVIQQLPFEPTSDPSASSLEAVKKAGEIVLKLRNHPCILFWCLSGPCDRVVDQRAKEAAARLAADFDPTRRVFPCSVFRGNVSLWDSFLDGRTRATVWQRVRFGSEALPPGPPRA
ncbi:MAG: hypothetical protein FJ278_13415, partial [Planctomycetes bacterium]|nr:hypothetical protein [Planctomycetota bacterium]